MSGCVELTDLDRQAIFVGICDARGHRQIANEGHGSTFGDALRSILWGRDVALPLANARLEALRAYAMWAVREAIARSVPMPDWSCLDAATLDAVRRHLEISGAVGSRASGARRHLPKRSPKTSAAKMQGCGQADIARIEADA